LAGAVLSHREVEYDRIPYDEAPQAATAMDGRIRDTTTGWPLFSPPKRFGSSWLSAMIEPSMAGAMETDMGSFGRRCRMRRMRMIQMIDDGGLWRQTTITIPNAPIIEHSHADYFDHVDGLSDLCSARAFYHNQSFGYLRSYWHAAARLVTIMATTVTTTME
jgi:hypothetical protein